jgi:flagellar motor switch protein FliM
MDTNIAMTELARCDAKDATAMIESARAVVVVPWMSRIEEHPSWETLSQMRMTMRAQIPLYHFKVQNLLALKEGQVFESLSPNTDDVPLKFGRMQLGWGEFEVAEQQIALRVTRLA